MSQQATTPDLDSFLDHELTPSVPSNLNDNCGICIRPWSEDTTAIVSLPCHHEFHRGCIEPWLTEGEEKVATCPICRRRLCIRPDPFKGSFSIAMEHFESPENYWEDMDASRVVLADLLPTLFLAVNTIWQGLVDDANWADWESLLVERAIVFDDAEDDSGSDREHRDGEEETVVSNERATMAEERDVDEVRLTGRNWAYLIMHVLKTFRYMDQTGLAEPCSSMEFLVLVVIMDLLEEKAAECNLDTTALVAKMVTFDDYQEHAETRTIEEAYRAVGLRSLIPETGLVSRMLNLTVW